MPYATESDLATGHITQDVLTRLNTKNPGSVAAALTKASKVADTYLRSQYVLPLAPPYDEALTEAVCAVAAFNLMCLLGFNPDSVDLNFGTKRRDALAWLRDVGQGKANIDVAVTPTFIDSPNMAAGRSAGYGSDLDVYSQSRRGLTGCGCG